MAVLDDLIKQGEMLVASAKSGSFGTFVNASEYEQWKRSSLMYLQQEYPNNPQTKDFESKIDYGPTPKSCKIFIGILYAFLSFPPRVMNTDYDGILSNLFEKFNAIVRQIQRRYSNRPTLIINDEYDVQDLLHALLRGAF